MDTETSAGEKGEKKVTPTTRVDQVMSLEFLTATVDTCAGSALRLSVDNGDPYVIVLDRGLLNGVVSARDLSIRSPATLVGEVMRSPVLVIGPHTTVEDAAVIMEEQDVGFLPVIVRGEHRRQGHEGDARGRVAG